MQEALLDPDDPVNPMPDARAPEAPLPRPAISVLLPCRDAGDTLTACLRSLRGQTRADFEVVAVDDGSRDATRSLLRGWARRDRRVRILDGRGRGLVPALEAAAAAARGSLLARMDADDVAHPRRLELQTRFLARHPGLAACGARVRLFPREELGSGYRRYERWINGLGSPAEVERDLFVECPVPHPTLLIRREAFDLIGGYRDRGWPEDYDLVLRLHRAGFAMANVPRVLLRWRVTPDRLSLRSPAYAPDAFRRCKVHHLLRGSLPVGRPLLVWGAGRVGKALSRELRRQGRPIDAFVDLDPRKIGQEVHGAPVWPPRELRARARCSPEPYVLAAVGSPGARAEIRAALTDAGLKELRDFRALA